VVTLAGQNAIAGGPLSGASIYEDVCRYDGFGQHRYGSAGAAKALDWISDELSRAGLEVSSQVFTMGRQYDFEQGSLSVEGRAISVVPQWWVPESLGSFTLSAPIVPTGDAHGAFIRLTIPYDGGAYLTDAHRAALQAAFARHPAGVFLTIDHLSDEIFTYNVDQEQTPWPVPVMLVARKDKVVLDAADAMSRPLTLMIKGSYRRDVQGRNVIGRVERRSGRAIVLSTPVTSWFRSTCERAPGIAAFLAVARIAHAQLCNVDLVFVATAGHEIGHGGMDHFIREEAPLPEAIVAWVHFGSSLACYAWQRDAAGNWVTERTTDRTRFINRTRSLDDLIRRHFKEVKAIDRIGDEAAVGELQDVRAAGYPHFFGMNGRHAFFHTPADTAAGTGPEALEPVVHAFAGALIELSSPMK
jgi:hypothetical protein